MAKPVLIVDDNLAVRSALVRLFSDNGFDVCGEAESGKEAIEKAQGLNPGLIVMDIAMPGMSGIDAAQSLRQLMPTVPIILLSDYVLQFHEASSLGIAATVSKSECMSVLLFEARILLHQISSSTPRSSLAGS